MNRMNKMNRLNKKRITKKKKVGGKSTKTKKKISENENDVDMEARAYREFKLKPYENVDIDKMFPKPQSYLKRMRYSNRQSDSKKLKRNSVTKTKKKTSKIENDTADYNREGAIMKITANLNKNKNFSQLPPPTPSKFDKDYWSNVYNEYLGDLLFAEENEKELKKEIMEKSFGTNTYFSDLFQKIESALPEKEKNKKWVDCVNECFSQSHDNVMQEIGSTAYMLRVLTKSVVGDTTNNQIIFSLDDKANLTGKWENDKKYFKMKIFRKDGSRKVCKGRLIMGFGPSASGKTYCANKVIELMSSIDDEFPKFFMTVDGGVFREESLVYQTIIKAIGEKGEYDGLTNLVSTSGIQKSIFESKIIKDTMKQYLREQKKNNKFVVCLYVPETLSGCLRRINCYSSYEDYIDITGDKDWIGLMIFQHKEHSDCPYKKDYKCKGTTESGESREKTEGKKYSSIAWKRSHKNGNYAIAQAETYRFRIHNSGRRDGITVFEDLSPKKIDIENKTISKFFKDSNWQYVDGKVKYNSECEKYSNKCSKAKKRSNSESSVE